MFIPTLIGVSLVIFLLLRVMPGDVAAAILGGPSGEGTFTEEDVIKVTQELGLDRPIYIQYLDWMWGLVRGDLGTSFVLNKPIFEEFQRQVPVTLQLGVIAFTTIILTSIPIGIIAAVKQDGLADYFLRGFSIFALAIPTFFLGLLLILVMSRFFNWLPPLGFSHIWVNPSSAIQQMVPAAIALGIHSSGLLMRLTRTQLLECMREDYIRTARAKGVAEKVVIIRHGLRNALLPIITYAGFQFGVLFSGTVVIELIFNLPGIGRGLLDALFLRDLPTIQAYIMYFAFVSLAINLVVDLTYAWLDPRIRYE
ncbi:MAG: peptide/nickel transport system permease protein [Chloroflexi bacterium]|jgi:peptide/nickel transport system permease protein|nr:MAG: peptide/nickel transport system permease protein [Chloroflexota bacterium]